MARPSPHDGVVYRSLSAGYSCNERKQIPLFRGLRTATVPFVGEGKRTGTLSTEWRNLLSKRRRLRKGEGAIYQRDDSQFWQVWYREYRDYRDQKGEIQRESTGATDRQQAERFLRDRLDARDEGRLQTVLNSKQLTFGQWADWFLEQRSKPPFRSEGNHQQNLNAMKFLRPVFGEVALSRYHRRGYRGIPGGATPIRPQGSHQVRPAAAGERQARNGSSGVPNSLSHAQCCSEAEETVGQPLSGRSFRSRLRNRLASRTTWRRASRRSSSSLLRIISGMSS